MEAATDPLTYKWLTHILTDTKLRALKPRASAFRIEEANGIFIAVCDARAELTAYLSQRIVCA